MFTIIIYLIISIILFIIIYKILKSIIKATLFLLIITIIPTIILGYLLYADFKDIQSNLQINPNLIILEKNNLVISGFILNFNKDPQVNLSNQQDINNYNSLYQNKDFFNLKSTNYKLIIIKYDNLIQNLPETIQRESITLSKQQLSNIMISEQPFTELKTIISLPESEIKNILNLKNEGELKSAIFFLILQENIKSVPEVLKMYKEGNIEVYEETILFKSVKYIPEDILSQLAQA